MRVYRKHDDVRKAAVSWWDHSTRVERHWTHGVRAPDAAAVLLYRLNTDQSDTPDEADFALDRYKAWRAWAMRRREKIAQRKVGPTLTGLELFEQALRQDLRCAITGLDLRLSEVGTPYTPSVDRIDSSRGYARDNVRVVLLAINTAMNQWGHAAFLRLIQEWGARGGWGAVPPMRYARRPGIAQARALKELLGS